MNFKIDKDKLEIVEPRIINSGSIAYYSVDCEFDDNWNGLTKKAILIKKGDSQGTEVSVIDNQIYIDKEYFGDYFVGFVGYTLNNDNQKILQISTNLKGFYVDKGAGEITAIETEIPTATEWEIYIQQLQAIADLISSDKQSVINTKLEVEQLKEDTRQITENFEVDIQAKIDQYNQNATEKTNEFNENSEEKKGELNDIADGVRNMATAIQLPQFYVDERMRAHGVFATKLSNVDLYIKHGKLMEGVTEIE